MKLLRLKLLSKFRGLNKGFEIIFDETVQEQKLEPICFVGLNGSGKSNILEVVSEIFYYLENFVKGANQNSNDFGFEISYTLSKQAYQMNSNKPIESDLEVLIIKKINQNPIVSRKKGKENIKDVLPTQIVGYSSGMNELISNPYIKMDFQYLDEFDKLIGEDVTGDTLSLNRMFFMDYDLNKLITVCNFLFDEDKNLAPLTKEIKIESLHSFTISLQLRKENKKPIDLPSRLEVTIEKLKQCSTLYHEKKKKTSKGKYKEYIFTFWVNESTKEAVKKNFGNAFELFKDLYFLRLLNNHLIGSKTQKQIREGDIKTNISALLPKHEEVKKIFNISDIAFRKEGLKEPIYYKQLSDGEHQLLHVVGMMLLVDREGTLFLLDEPETHFNPDWRSKFVSILNECVQNENGIREQEVVLTTHSPFIVSDCKPEKVFRFFRNKNHKIDFEQPNFNTYGASVNKITSKLFKKKETISNLVLRELKAIKEKFDDKQITQEEAKKALDIFGESIEKMLVEKYFERENN